MCCQLLVVLNVFLAVALAFAANAADLQRGLRAYEDGDYATAFREFMPLAESGNIEAQYHIGRLYHMGEGVPQDFSAALRWYRDASAKGHGVAANNIGVMYESGDGVPQDFKEARMWYRRGAERGVALAQSNLGVLYYDGKGGSVDLNEAFKWLQRAATGGSPRGQYNLARMFFLGQGTQEDSAEAAKWFRRAAEQGLPQAQQSLGLLYAKGSGVPQDTTESLKWYLRAADGGIPEAQHIIGLAYAEGFDRPKSDSDAVKWFRRAAEQGYAESQLRIGFMYSTGAGVTADPVVAAKWYLAAASQGLDQAQHNLAVLYEAGRGVKKDPAEAAIWYRRAADQDHASAKNNLGRLYERGDGVPKDLVLAHMWYNLAASSANAGEVRDMAVGNRNRVASALKPAELTKAQQLARDWKPGASPQTSSSDTTSPAVAKAAFPSSSGSGFLVGEGGQIITNFHVIDGCREVRAKTANSQSVVAQVLATDSKNDLALLKIAARTPAAASFRDGRGIRTGDRIVVVGFPLQGLLASQPNVTTGTVSALAGISDDTRHLQITAPVQAGNSGGPLLDESGNVVGVVVGKLNALRVALETGDFPENVNFAIHAGIARVFLEANRVDYRTAPSQKPLPIAEVSQRAAKAAALIECWK